MLKDKSMSLEPYNFRNNIEFWRNQPFILDLGIKILWIKSMIYINGRYEFEKHSTHLPFLQFKERQSRPSGCLGSISVSYVCATTGEKVI